MVRGLVTGPSPMERVRKDKLTHIGVRSKLGVYYTMPDMTAEMVTEALDHLARGVDQLVIRNLSGATLVLPTRIIGAIYRLDINENAQIHATSPHGSMAELWVAT